MAYYAEAELYLIRLIADAAARTGNSPNWAEASLLEVRRMRRAVHQLNTQMARDVPDLLIDAVDQAYTTGRVDAETELQKIKSEALPPSAIDHQAVVSLTRPGLESLAPVHQHLARNVENVWTAVTREVASQSVIGVKTTRQATQDAMNRLAREGMGFYRDKAGRRWGLDTYSEMAVRSTTNNALRAGHSSRLIEAGYDLVIVSSHKNPAPQCAPFERKVLSLTGGTPSGTQVVEGEIVNVVASMSEAEAAGLHHPNAILGGDQAIDTFAGSVGASKCAYAGPAITIRTAKGNTATVSPEHPILTSSGWRTAESLSVGDYVFNTLSGERGSTGVARKPNFEDVPTTVEDEFVSLKNRGSVTRIPSTGHNFDDDRQFLKGEIDVVVTDDCLLPVPDTKVIKETGEVLFVGADVRGVGEVRDSALTHRGGGVLGSVGGPLADLYPGFVESAADGGRGGVEDRGELLAGHSAGVHGGKSLDVDLLVPPLDGGEAGIFEPLAYRRAGDSSDPSDINVAVSGLMEPDYVVDIDRVSFDGHAYDFQTVDGVYSINGIITHNCRHTHSLFQPGVTPVEEPEPDPGHEGYKATQRQRYLERQVRASKRLEAAALDEEAARKARARARHYQGELREHVEKWGLPRRRHREQLSTPTLG